MNIIQALGEMEGKVIIRAELIYIDGEKEVLKLNFDDGSFKEISCDMTEEGIHTIKII